MEQNITITGGRSSVARRYADREYDEQEKLDYPYRYYYDDDVSDQGSDIDIVQTSNQYQVTNTVHHHAPWSARAILAFLALIAGVFVLVAAIPYMHTIFMIAAILGGITTAGLILRFIVLPICGQVQNLFLTHKRAQEQRWLDAPQPHEGDLSCFE